MGGAPDVGGASNLGGGANIAGVASVGVVPDVGASNLGGAGTAGGDLQAQSGIGGVRDASNAVGHASGQFGEESVGAQVQAPLGVEGNRIVDGGGRGVVDGELGSSDYDVGAKAQYAAHAEALDQRDAGQAVRDAAIERSGYNDPRAVVGEAEVAELHARDGKIGEVSAAQDRVADARYVAANPADAARSEATYRVSGEAAAHVPTQAKVAAADVNVVRDAAHNPEAAAEGQLDVRVEGAELEEEHKLGVTGVVPPSGGGTDKK